LLITVFCRLSPTTAASEARVATTTHLRCKTHRCKLHLLSYGRLVIAKLRKTVRIAQFTGSRRSRDKKMEASREKNGCTHPDTLETGRRIRKMVSAFNSTTMATSTKDCGKEISAMAKELTGVMKQESFVVSTQETGMKTRNMVEVLSSTKTVTDTTDTGSQECLRAKAE
jgi:hypothetical protein